MEMTGLDVQNERVLEVAGIVTDLEFKELSQFHSVVYQSPELLAKMDNWNQTHHSQSGLLALVPNAPKEAQVEQALIDWMQPFFKDQKAILSGNSIAQDRKFIDAQFAKFADKLHYRMLDVSSYKIMFENKFQQKFKKADKHRAIDDIRESIAELQFYLSFFKIP